MISVTISRENKILNYKKKLKVFKEKHRCVFFFKTAVYVHPIFLSMNIVFIYVYLCPSICTGSFQLPD